MVKDLLNKINLEHFLNDILIPWLLTSGIRIILIVVLSFVAYFLLNKVIRRIIRLTVKPGVNESKLDERQREETLMGVFSFTLKMVMILVSGLMVVSEFNVKIGPLLASAGIVGLAVGFGGQYLIRDVISGLFIIMENQYRIDDHVEIADIRGKVERITLRVTTLRDVEGITHHVPHGEIKTVSNLTNIYSGINMDVGVAYGSDIDQVERVINEVGKELANDPAWKDCIVEPPLFRRVQELADSAVVVKVTGSVQPAKQWEVSGELRRRFYNAFNENGIEIPFPQRVIHLADKVNIPTVDN